MRVIFANTTQGFVYDQTAGQAESMKFSRFSINDYAQYFKELNPDILCLSEVLIDNEEDQSEMVEAIAAATGCTQSQVLMSEKSWLYDGRFYGMAILSKTPLSDYESFQLPNPKFEIDRPNGDHWVMHDKYAQFSRTTIDGKEINLFNLHYFPVHHFKKNIMDDEMKTFRSALAEVFLEKGFERPTIICGDFNDKGVPFKQAFPELLASGDLAEAIEEPTTIIDGQDQLDHILYTVSNLKVKETSAKPYLSDHYYLCVDFSFI